MAGPDTAQEPSIDSALLRHSVQTLAHAASFVEASAALNDVARAIGMPTMAWAPEVARPKFDAHMDAFLREQGWPDEVLTLWWGRNVMLSSPIYIRCRFKDVPFVTDVHGGGADLGRDNQRVAQIMLEMGLKALITAPVHLPRGQVAMVTWGGPLEPDAARVVLARTKPELLAAAHFFMDAFNTHVGVAETREEDLSRLTPREWDCLRLTAQGYREAEVGSVVGLAPTTVRFHLDNVARKLGASNRTHAVAIAVQLGLLGSIGS